MGTPSLRGMDIILIPGLWLNASSWDDVVPALTAAGHRAVPLTLPGLESPDADRTGISVADHVEAVVAAIDAATPPLLVVGHSAGSGLAWAAADARPDAVARVVMIGGFPAVDRQPLVDGFTAENGEVSLPPFDSFSDDDLRDLDEAALAAFRARAVPVPERVVTEAVRLRDPRRYDIPVTVVCPEFTAADLRSWIDAGEEPVAEFPKIADVSSVDLPTGHWPQFTRPAELAAVIVAEAAR